MLQNRGRKEEKETRDARERERERRERERERRRRGRREREREREKEREREAERQIGLCVRTYVCAYVHREARASEMAPFSKKKISRTKRAGRKRKTNRRQKCD